jgi:hypothetical protein
MAEAAQEKLPKLAMGQWLMILSGLMNALGITAASTGFSFRSNTTDPAIVELRKQVSDNYAETIKLREQVIDLKGRIRELEHEQGYDAGGDNAYYARKRPR